jgi:hypothetical protein
MRSSSGVASFNQENEASDVEESGFGKTKEEILWPCHEGRLGALTRNAGGEWKPRVCLRLPCVLVRWVDLVSW